VDQLKRISTLWWPQALIGGLLIYCTIVLGYTVRQSDFSRIILHYGLWFVGYVALYNLCSAKELRFWVIFSLLLRLILVFGLPTLSDDVYRFIWDGRLWLNGINPFDHKPSFYIENGLEIPGLDLALFQQLNSPDYFTIYPPMAQLIFVIACWIFPSSILGSSVVMKLFLLAAEVGSLLLIRRLLQHFKRSPKLILLYALNPLIVIEIVGNLHFEGVMVFFLLLAYWFWIKGSWWKGAVAMTLSIVSKLLPLMFLPFVIRRMGWKKSIWTFLLLGVLIIACFLPLFNAAFIHNFSDSLDLYFRRFEFNGSVYYLARWIGYQIVGYNLIAEIGPVLALLTLLSISLFAFWEKNEDWESWPSRALFAITVYLLMGMIIHPWYLSLPIVLCLFTRFRYPILWSGLIFMTYINYSYTPYFENLWVVVVEYGVVVLVMVGEWRDRMAFLLK
jgi:alpha-1,6-mannosyltransferase